MKIGDYYFPVKETNILFNKEGIYTHTDDFKGIIANDNQLVSVMRKTYKLVPNKDIIEPLLNELEQFDSKWLIDNSHSFIAPNRMRLQITFPELTFKDEESENALSLFLHNSYDGSEGVRMFWGGIRYICTNGMIFGTTLGKSYSKHSKGFRIDGIRDTIRKTYDRIPDITARIKVLQELDANEEKLLKGIKDNLGTGIYKEAEMSINSEEMSQWALYNVISQYVSHVIAKEQRAKYQIATSKIFNL